MHFCFVIGVNKITDLDIDFRFYYRLQDLSNGKNKKVDRSSILVAQEWGKLLKNFPNRLDFS